MPKPLRLVTYVVVGLALLALAALAPQQSTQADTPIPWEEYGGLDGYYIANGWTEGYSSRPLSAMSTQGAAPALPHKVYLPLVMGSSQGPSVLRETRALWVTRWDFREPRDIEIIVDKAASANLNVILFQVRGQADALYTPGLEPWSATLSGTLGKNPGWDPLAKMIAEAHNRGIEVHAWINAYPAWLGTTAPSRTASPLPMYHAFNDRFGNDWVLWRGPASPSPAGLNSSYLYGSPGNPNVTSRIVNVCKDIVSRYDVDGLHFDYIRYDDQGRPYSFDPVSQEAYQAARAANSALSYDDWQRAQITGLLQRVRQEALSGHPGVRLTTSAWPIYKNRDPNGAQVYSWFPTWGTDGYHSIYQDSWGWARTGVSDSIMPMFYTSSIHDYRDRFAQLCQDFSAGSRPGRFVAGIEGDYGSFDEIAWRIQTARDTGASGQALFSYRLFDQSNYWAQLRNGPYSQVAVPNWP